MTGKKGTPDKAAELRRRAAARVEEDAMEAMDLSPEDAASLVHELRTHQIELEMQNEELRRAQAELEQSRDQYSDLYDFAPVGYLTLNDKGLIQKANLTLCDMLGSERRLLQNVPFSALVSPEDQDTYYLKMKRLKQRRERHCFELRLTTKRETAFPALIDVVPAGGDADCAPQWRMAVSDISEQKQAEEKIRGALVEKRLLLRELNHRVKNNMQVMASLLRLQARKLQNPEAQAALQEAQNRISAMVACHKALFESNTFERVRLRDLVEHLGAGIFGNDTMEPTVRFSAEISETLSFPAKQATSLSLVLNELLTNALKHAFEGGGRRGGQGSVTISARESQAGKLLIVLQDNGVGIPETLDLKRCETLGLTIARDIVTRQLRGSLAFRRTGGTEVTIEIPFTRQGGEKATERYEPPAPAHGSRKRVMIVEDEPLTSMEMQQTVRSLGHEVVATVDSAEEAVKRFGEILPDMVFMDIKLRGRMNGIQAAAEIRKQAEKVPLTLVSGILEQHLEEVKELPQPVGLLLKPFSTSQLREELERELPHPIGSDAFSK